MERIVNLHLEKLSEGFYLAIGENGHLSHEAREKNHPGGDMTPEKLAFYNINMKYVVEPGVFEIMTGPSWRDEDLQKTELTVK